MRVGIVPCSRVRQPLCKQRLLEAAGLLLLFVAPMSAAHAQHGSCAAKFEPSSGACKRNQGSFDTGSRAHGRVEALGSKRRYRPWSGGG